jgi:hypothetical protein
MQDGARLSRRHQATVPSVPRKGSRDWSIRINGIRSNHPRPLLFVFFPCHLPPFFTLPLHHQNPVAIVGIDFEFEAKKEGEPGNEHWHRIDDEWTRNQDFSAPRPNDLQTTLLVTQRTACNGRLPRLAAPRQADRMVALRFAAAMFAGAGAVYAGMEPRTLVGSEWYVTAMRLEGK